MSAPCKAADHCNYTPSRSIKAADRPQPGCSAKASSVCKSVAASHSGSIVQRSGRTDHTSLAL